jgi:glucose-1-phosphate thymidylyltransferase
MKRKGIILAGGSGTRLLPATQVVSKHLLPVYDKPMIYYPLCVLMLAGIQDILIISTPRDVPLIKDLIGDGKRWGIEVRYAVQEHPRGVADALIVAREHVRGSPIALALGDNIFFGQGFGSRLLSISEQTDGATVFAYRVGDPERYGVVVLDSKGSPTQIEEKPSHPRSNHAVTGLYFYDETAPQRAEQLAPSSRGELEITDVNRTYLDEGKLRVEVLGRGYAWLDAGTSKNLLSAGQFVETIEERQGFKICCPEEVAWRRGFIDDDQLVSLAEPLKASGYGRYLLDLISNERR